MNFELWENYATKATLRMDCVVELRHANKVTSVAAISKMPNNDTIYQLFKLKMNFKLGVTKATPRMPIVELGPGIIRSPRKILNNDITTP